ncbi:MAG TPA: glycosyltransferase family 4 protein [Actinomycetota bacterium]|nr:glycosyltransferase family 4 protein [Actinomycetota bacterium]
MRVIHVSPTAFGGSGLYGGGERYPVELARALAQHVDCEVVTFGPRGASYRDGPLHVTVLERSFLLRRHPAHPVAGGLVRALKRADLVHTHHVRAFPSRVAAVAAYVRKQPRVATDHGLGPGRSPALDARLFDRFLTVSRYSAATLSSPASKTTVIYGGADTDRFHPGDEQLRQGVLFVGRLTPHKGIDRLIAALPQGATLTLAGTFGHDRELPERAYEALLRSLARGRDVRFAGPVPEDHLPALYRHARVLVLPSVDETCYGKHVAIPELLGLALLEAMASGTPVVASNIGGLPEVVADGVTGFVVEPGNVAALRERLEELLGDDRLHAQMSRNARDHVVGNFTWARCAERCLSAYEELVGAA